MELTYLKLDDYDGTISTAVSGESAPDIYFMYPWMAGRSEFDAAFAHAEDLSAPELGLDLDCLREGLLFRDESGALPMAPVFSTTYGMLVNEDLFEAADVAVPETYADLLDDVTIQKRRAVFAVGNGTMTIDQAVAAYGSISE